MKVVYLSAIPGHGAATSNMIIMAMMTSLNTGYRSLMFQCGDSYDNLDRYLLGYGSSTNPAMVSEREFPFYYGKGIDAILKKVSIGREAQRDKKAFMACCADSGVRNSYFLPSPLRKNPRLYYSQMNTYIHDIMSWCNREFDITFVDNKEQDRELYERVNMEADLIVINTSQSSADFRRAVELKRQFYQKKCVIVIGRYENQCKESYERLRRNSGLNAKDVLVVPYDRGMLNALLGGSVAEYIKAYHMRNSSNSRFGIRTFKNGGDDFWKGVTAYYNGMMRAIEGVMGNSQQR